MDAKQFLIEFQHIASAPNGVEQLRQMVMGLALAGNIVMNNESLPENFESHLEAAKQHYFDDIGRRPRPFINGESLIQEFRIPSGWRWVRVGEVCDLQTGATPSTLQAEFYGGEIRWLASADVNKGEIYDCEGRITEAGLKNSNCKILPSNCVLIALNGQGKTRATVAILRVPAACSQSIVAIIPFSQDILNPEYLHLSLKYRYYEIRDITGQKQRRGLNMGLVSELSIPIPPTSEQKRIVAKVDELMALCDKLEAQQQERREHCKRIQAATLQTLVDAEDSLTLFHAWSRVQANTNTLLDGEQGLTVLHDSLKKLAVRGFLSQWSKEDPAIDEIKATCSSLKQEYSQKKLLRKPKPILSKIDKKNEYPSHWAVIPFDEVAIIIGGVTKGRDLRGRNVQSYPYLRVANVQRGFFDLSEMKHIEIPVDEFAKYYVERGDLLITEGGDWDKVGRTAVWAEEIDNCLHQNHVFKARVPSTHLLNKWVELVFNSGVGREYFARAAKQTTNLASINMTQLRSFPLPIPPTSEQIAILQRLDHLTSLCNKLEKQWIESKNIASLLAEATITSITGIRTEIKEKMKIPKTELVSTLRIGVSPANRDHAPLATILIRNNGELPAKSLWNMSGLEEIDAFYQQLRTEMAKGWIVQPEVAYIREGESS